MKSQLFAAAAAAMLLSAPLVSYAQQSNEPVTRAEVRAQLQQIEQAGYHENDNTTYPASIQAAETKVSEQTGDAQSAQSGFGPAMVPSTQSGAMRVAPNDGTKSIYFGQ
jgi:hypothetical protein